MPYLLDAAKDLALDYLTDNGTRIDICSTEPTTYAEATTTYSLGNKTGLTVGAPTNGDVSGRKVIIPAITDGSVTGTNTAAFWALSDGSAELLAVGDLSSPQGVTSGNTFLLPAIDVTIPDPV